MSPLLLSLQENSIPRIAVSALIGAIAATGVRFVFDQFGHELVERRRSARAARAAVRKYSYPLLRAADTLDKRIENLARFPEAKWFDDTEDDYYRLSTLYLFGRYFAWCKILDNEAFLEYLESDKRASRFSIQFNRVFKGITGFYYFQDLVKEEGVSPTEVEAATVPRLALTAIGELMIAKPEDKDGLPTVIDFVDFARTYTASDDFKRWFRYLEGLLSDMKPSKTNSRWNRLLVFASNLRAFVSYLDPAQRQTAPRKIYYLGRIHPRVESRLRDELEGSGFSDLIAA